MAKREDWVYDELLCFLGNPFFQVPVLTFMEAKCLIFDPSIEDSEEYKNAHQEYKAIIQKLLDAFMKDTGVTHDQVIGALNDMNSKQDIKEMFQSLFEQFFAAEDYHIFVRLMVQKNIELQQQALAMILQKQGVLPDSLKEGKSAPPPPPPTSNDQYGAQNEDDIMRAVLEQSKKEYEEEQKRRKSEKEAEEKKKEVETLIQISHVEHSRLEEEKSREKVKLDQALLGLSIETPSSTSPSVGKPPSGKTEPPPQSKPVPQTDLKSAPSIAVTPAPAAVPAQPVAKAGATAAAVSLTSQKLPQVSQQKPHISSAEAAANWMKQADNDSTPSASSTQALNAAAAAMSNMNPEELKKRQEYLKQQRDKLLEMKKKEREKQLLTAEKSQPKRPMSARAAKSALKDGGVDAPAKLSPEEEKKLAMRKAIADRLKAEMLGK